MTCWYCKKAEGNYWGLCEPCLRIRNQEVAHMETKTFDDPECNSDGTAWNGCFPSAGNEGRKRDLYEF